MTLCEIAMTTHPHFLCMQQEVTPHRQVGVQFIRTEHLIHWSKALAVLTLASITSTTPLTQHWLTGTLKVSLATVVMTQTDFAPKKPSSAEQCIAIGTLRLFQSHYLSSTIVN